MDQNNKTILNLDSQRVYEQLRYNALISPCLVFQLVYSILFPTFHG